MSSTENGTSRQRVVRVPIPYDDWLLECAKEKRREDDDSRAGVATEINAHIKAAYEKDMKRRKRESKRI